jgi:hypothetical protein
MDRKSPEEEKNAENHDYSAMQVLLFTSLL